MNDIMGHMEMTVWCSALYLRDEHERCDGWFCTCPCHVMASPERLGERLYNKWVGLNGFVGVL